MTMIDLYKLHVCRRRFCNVKLMINLPSRETNVEWRSQYLCPGINEKLNVGLNNCIFDFMAERINLPSRETNVELRIQYLCPGINGEIIVGLNTILEVLS